MPRMGSFKRSFFGYRRPQVDAALSARDREIGAIKARLAEHDSETAALSGMVIERERLIRDLGERLREANECHDRSIASLDAVTARLEEMQAQARGQATRIRMKALKEAVEVSRRIEAVTGAEPGVPAAANGAGQSNAAGESNGTHEGKLKMEIGPLGDFSQLVGFEDAIGKLGASEISVERFSEGRATLSMRLDQPVELLRELEGLSGLDFKVRHNAPDNVILDLDEDAGPEQRAA